MSVFEQCVPYRDFGLEKDLTCDVLEDDEDILTQISAQLDIPSFVTNDQDVVSQPLAATNSSVLHHDYLPPIEGLESGILDDVMMDDFSSYTYPDSGYSDGSIKSEPCSPSSSSQDQSPPLSPVQGYSLLNNVNTIITQPVAINAINSLQSIPSTTLSGKVAIPKLVKSTPTPAPLVTTTVNSNVGAPLVLLCNQTPSNGPIIVKTEPVSSASFGNPLITGLPTVTGHSSAEELRNLKRQQRMIKNRESACISRKKKKEYVTQLEDQIKTLSSENMLLKNENENLKQQLREMQSQLQSHSEKSPGPQLSSSKKTTAALAMLFMVSLNMNSLSGIYNNANGGSDATTTLNKNVHVRDTGRTLLWVDDSLPSDSEKNFLSNITDSISNQCGTNLNQTESIRLESDLRGWFNVEPSDNKRRPVVKRRPTRSPSKKVAKSANYPVGNVVKTPLHSLTGSVYHMLLHQPVTNNNNALSFYNNYQRNSFSSFFDAIDRRDDTFYVVSFSGDHLLVPATNHTKTSRPLMSLMLPAVVSSNSTETNQSDSIAMMKIDCQVINTQMLHIMKDAIPVQMADNLKSDKPQESTYQNDGVFSNYKKNASRKSDNRTTFQTQNFDQNEKRNFKKKRNAAN